MRRRELSLTTLGLSAHDEHLMKSFLGVIEGRTSVNWTLIDDLDEADVAICEPGNALSNLARTCERDRGRPACLAVVSGADAATGWSRLLHRPLRIREFMDALDTLATELLHTGPAQPAAPAVGPARAQGSACSALSVLRALHGAGDHAPRTVVLRAAGVEIVVHLPQAKCYFPSGYSDDLLQALADERVVAQVEERTDSRAAEALAATHWVWLETLLWSIGRRVPGCGGIDPGNPNQVMHLKCWPDLGRIPSQPHYIKLTALLTKQTLSIKALAAAAGVDEDAVLAFVRACACCGILEVSDLAGPPAEPPRGRLSGMFNVLRAALGMRV